MRTYRLNPTCVDCGTKIANRYALRCGTHARIGKRNPFFSKKHSPEMILKLKEINKNKAKRGEKAYQWIKDRNKLQTSRRKSYDTKYRYWMASVKKRDNWKCRIADINCDGRLEAHHILNWKYYPELRYEINNGITLCRAHHPLKRVDEVKLSPYFQKLVAEGK